MKLTVAAQGLQIAQIRKLIQRVARDMQLQISTQAHELGLDIDTKNMEKSEIQYLVGVLESYDLVAGVVVVDAAHESAIDHLTRQSTSSTM